LRYVWGGVDVATAVVARATAAIDTRNNVMTPDLFVVHPPVVIAIEVICVSPASRLATRSRPRH
jgi:hypothetical protein